MNGNETHACPGEEELGAWLDGEETARGDIAAHVAECPSCRKTVEDYKRLGEAFARVLSSEIPDTLESGILSRIRMEQPPRQSYVKSHLPWILRIAALIAMAAFFLYLVIDRHETQKAHIAATSGQPSRTAPSATNSAPSVSSNPVARSTPSYPVLSAPANNLIRTVGTNSDGYSSGATALDVDPILLQSMSSVLSSFELNPPESPECVHKTFDLSEDVTAGVFYPQLRNALASMDVPNVSFAVRRLNDHVTAVVEIHSANRLSLVRHNNTLEFRVIRGEDSDSVQASSVRYELEFICKPADATSRGASAD